MDQYSSPDPDMMAYERGQLPMVRYASLLLWALVSLAVLLFLGLNAGAVYWAVTEVDNLTEFDVGLPILGMSCVGLMALVWSVPQIAAAIGLRRGAKWAWYLTIGIGALYALMCCPGLVFGGPLLFLVLNDEVRNAFTDA